MKVGLWVCGLTLLLAMGGPAVFAQPCDITPSEYWKNTIEFPDEPFRVRGDSEANPDWVKFTIALCDPDNVYYQESNVYRFHYGFATELLDPFVGMTHEQFDNVSLYATGQEAVLGAVIMPASWITPPRPQINEYGIQLVRHDPYTPQEIVDLFHQVRNTVDADPGVQAFYFPTYEQYEVAQQNIEFLEQNGVYVSSPARWAVGNSCYSEGWALGALKYFAPEDIEDAYENGLLTPYDILITDGVPAEVPFVAGIMTLLPATPNSHVVILADSYDIPFVHWANAEDAEAAMALVGQTVAFTAYEDWGYCDARLLEVGSSLTPQQITEILALKALPPLNITPTNTYGAYSQATDGMVLSDIQYFGGKAANFGFLRRAIPDSSPISGAFSFDVWNEFLDQDLEEEGMSLRAYIQEILEDHSWPPNFAQLADDLDDIRDLIKDDDLTHFTPELQAAILSALQAEQYGFDPLKKIRFRSSTNVEDSEQFIGAGLYDSKSGCLADDLDGDDIGPSHCDPTQDNERGVFRALRRVFASFYLDNAFLERLRWGVNEEEVGMAVLFHHSFPDEIELGNGVATLHRHSSGSAEVFIVSQPGAESVTNPEGGMVPEEVRVGMYGTYFSTQVLRYSSLLVLGETVLEFPDEYESLASMMRDVADDYATAIGQTQFILDFEYKKVAPGGGVLPEGGLVVKQVRKLPEPNDTASIVPFLINDPVDYCTYQGEDSDVFAIHRLKSEWTLSTQNMWLDERLLEEQTIYDDVALTFTDGCWTHEEVGPLASFPGFDHGYDGEGPYYVATLDHWREDGLPNNRTYTLRTDRAGELVSPAESPLLTISDLGTPNSFFRYNELAVTVRYEHEVPAYTWEGWISRAEESALIVPCPTVLDTDILQERTLTDGERIRIDTSFYWPWGTAPAGYTAPLSRWVETTISGLTSEPIVLRGWYAQTYRPQHHNFGEHFIFEPRLDPAVPSHLLDELAEQRADLIYVSHSFDPVATIRLMSDDNCDNLACQDNSSCGYPVYGNYCAKAVGDCDGEGVCTEMPLGCPDVWDPVCGCDGITYGNDCEAAAAGVNVEHWGACPEVCGGIAGIECREAGDYCNLGIGHCCCDFMGVCEPMPDPSECDAEFAPVCGCDGITYHNACLAAAVGMNIDYLGPCFEDRCGGIAGIPCEDERDFCMLPTGHCCCDYFGACTPVPETCPRLYDPVCGCDGRTYVNDCRARQARVSVDHWGPCTVTGACCLPDGTCEELPEKKCKEACGKYYGDGSICRLEVITPTDSLTDRSLPASGSATALSLSDSLIRVVRRCPVMVTGACCLHDGGCAQVTECECKQLDGDYMGDGTICEEYNCGDERCGGIAGWTCSDPDDFCLFPEGTCGDGDITGVCTPRPGGCLLPVIAPVCGCDGQEYVYDCFAYRAGVSIRHRGSCLSDHLQTQR